MRSNGKTLKWMTGIAVGGGLMYLADPDRGNRRRALAREKFVHGAHVLGTATDKALRDLRNRAAGFLFRNFGRLVFNDYFQRSLFEFANDIARKFCDARLFRVGD